MGMFEQGLAAIRRRQPNVAEILEAVGPPVSRLVEQDGRPTNIDLGDIRLYPTDAGEWVAGQLRGFAAEPERLVFVNPNHCNLSDCSMVLWQSICNYARAHLASGDITLADAPEVESGFMVVFGVGLGLHLPRLIEEYSAYNYVLLEPVAEFLRHSLSVIDWEDLYAKVEERGGSILIAVSERPEDMVRLVEGSLIRAGETFIDGSYFYIHYYSWALKEAYTLLQEKIKVHTISSGFFEDEQNMMRNSAKNLADRSLHIIEPKPYLAQPAPLFIVASGPSLDKDLPHLRKWRDKAIIMSCGTSLGVLLKNGLTPDIHVENENVPLVTEIIGKLADQYDLGKVILAATVTVDPGLAKLFSRHWFYFRGGLSPRHVFAPRVEAVYGADPLVANAGLALAIMLGFKSIYLFGVDCGAREETSHHSKSAFYNEDEKRKEETDAMWKRRFDRVVPGNFGGKVYSAWHLDLSRRMFTEVIRGNAATVFNCSDGARIDHTRPLAAAAIRLTGGIDHATVLRRLEAQLKHVASGQLFSSSDMDRHIQACDIFAQGITRTIAGLADKPATFATARQAVDAFVAEAGDTITAPFVITRGSLFSMLRLGAFFGTRIREPEGREDFYRRFLEMYEERVLTITQGTKDLLTEVRAQCSLSGSDPL